MAVTTRHDTQELLTQSIGPACHELRSPLAVVYGFAKMLDTDDKLDGTTRRYVAQIVNGAQRLDDLLDLLSKLGRIASGRLQPTLENVSLKGVLNDLCSTNANSGRMRVDEDMTDVHVKADPGWLCEAIHGVVDALCFEDDMEVRCSWTHDHHEVVLSVRPGASYPMIDVEPEKSSLSLGLARMRVVAMGGTLDGQSDRITISLPRT